MANHVHSELRESLRELGLRATAPRLAVLAALHEAAAPLAHDEVMLRIGEGFDRATVYRLLADLAEAGLLRRMDLGDHVWRYELLDACRAIADDHAHFLCTTCGEVACLPEVEVRAVDGGRLPEALRGADVELKLTGTCRDCQGVGASAPIS